RYSGFAELAAARSAKRHPPKGAAVARRHDDGQRFLRPRTGGHQLRAGSLFIDVSSRHRSPGAVLQALPPNPRRRSNRLETAKASRRTPIAGRFRIRLAEMGVEAAI